MRFCFCFFVVLLAFVLVPLRSGFLTVLVLEGFVSVPIKSLCCFGFLSGLLFEVRVSSDYLL